MPESGMMARIKTAIANIGQSRNNSQRIRIAGISSDCRPARDVIQPRRFVGATKDESRKGKRSSSR